MFLELGCVAALPMATGLGLTNGSKINEMKRKKYDIIIIGGSYAGLAAAMTLGRALKNVLVIDSGKPCNIQTPHSHNFLTNDGRTPREIAALARVQVGAYDSVAFVAGTVLSTEKDGSGFRVATGSGEMFFAGKLIFATGIKDLLPSIQGLSECWGISVIHCPYCHGYEVRGEPTGILGDGEAAFDFARLISNWTSELTVFSNGRSVMEAGQRKRLAAKGIAVVEKKIHGLEHRDGQLDYVLFEDGSYTRLTALYAPSPFEQHCRIPQAMGCALTPEGYIQIDGGFETTVKNVYAIGDNSSKMRTVAGAVSMGTSAGLVISKKMILENF